MSSDPQSKPYHVRTNNGGLHSSYNGKAQADRAAHAANEEAKRLGIQTRYVVAERDAA